MKHGIAGARLPVAGIVAVVIGVASPTPARALALLEERLSLDGRPKPDLALAAADRSAKTAEEPPIDFDLLGPPPPPKVVAGDATLKRRRSMLQLHQGLGLGLLGLQLATTVVGQLNYLDKYGSSPPVTERYQLTHKALAYTTLGVFAVNGAVALLAPRAPGAAGEGFDRVTVHKVGMAAAALGMIAQGVVGYYTHQREGYLDQGSYARAHLVIGYATLAAMAVAVGALVL